MGIPPFLPLGERRSFFFDILLRALQMCRTAPGGAKTGIAAFQAARMTCAFRRAPRVPFRTDEKEPKVRLRTLRLGRPARAVPGARYARRPLAGAPPRDPGLSPLRGPGPTSRNSKRNLREYLAMTRELPSLPTGTPAEGSIQVAGAPNDRSRMARHNPRRKTTRLRRVRALCARARQSRAVFRLPVGAARHAKAAVPPRAHFRYGTGDSPAEALRPRRGGWRDAVGSFAHP